MATATSARGASKRAGLRRVIAADHSPGKFPSGQAPCKLAQALGLRSRRVRGRSAALLVRPHNRSGGGDEPGRVPGGEGGRESPDIAALRADARKEERRV